MIWFAVAACLLVSFMFSGIEAGILSVNRVRLRHRLKLRDRAAIILHDLLSRPERLLVTVLVVTNLMNIFAMALSTQEFVRVLGNWGYVVAGAIFVPIHLFGLELLPKSLFRRFPYRALAAFAQPLRIADLVLSPMHFAGSTVAKLLFGKRPADQQKLFVAREDFKYLTIESEREGALTKAERQMIHNVIDFRTVAARDVMVPISEVRTIEASASISKLLSRSAETHLDRWPIITETGDVTGLVHVLEIALDGRREGIIEPFQRRIVAVSPEEPAYSILRKLRAARITLAVVNGGDGKPVGIVTWEDLIKRLVSTAVDVAQTQP